MTPIFQKPIGTLRDLGTKSWFRATVDALWILVMIAVALLAWIIL